MWENIVESDRPRMTVWRMCFACWVTKALSLSLSTHTRARARTHARTHARAHARTHDSYCFSAATVVLRTCLCATFIRKVPVCFLYAYFSPED